MVSITRLCLLLLMSMLVSTASAEEAVTRGSTEKCILQTVCSINSKLQCNNAIAFGSADINKPGGYVISQPGYYCLKEDVVFNPTMSPIAPVAPTAPYSTATPAPIQAAITITASNVFLDLGPHRLSQAGAGTSTQVPFAIGILIPDPLPNSTDINAVGQQSVYIKGDDPAIIDGFSMYGVCIFAHTFDIRLTNMTIKNCGQLASLALRPTVYGFPYLPHTATITPGYGPSFGVAGLRIGESTSLGMGPVFFVDTPTNVVNNVNRVTQVVLENVSCLDNFMNGMISPCMTDVTINNCHFDRTYSDDPGSTVAPAYNVIPAFGVQFVNLGVLSGTVESGNGNIDPNCTNMVISNSTFNNTTLAGNGINSFSYTTPIVNGNFPCAGAVETRSRNVTFNNCEFCGSTTLFVGISGGGNTVGYVSGGIEDFTFNDCHFDNVTAINSINGFHISGTSANAPTKSNRNVRLINCSSNNHRFIGDQIVPAPLASTRSVVGFIIDYSKDCVLDSCVSQDLINNGPTTVAVFNSGFAPNSTAVGGAAQLENVTFRNCIASRILTLNGGNAYGFNMFTTAPDTATSVTYENCIASGNQVIFPPSFTAYSATVNYVPGNVVSFQSTPTTLPVNYVALAANGPASTVVTPGTNAAVWGVAIGSAVSVWNPTTAYVVGNIVEYLGNNYVAVANNTGVVPYTTSLAPQWNTTIIDIAPNTWSATTTYNLGSVASYEGVNYTSLVANNLGNIPLTSPADWSLATGVVQGAGIGFYTQQVNNLASAPTTFINCIADNNKGADAVTASSIVRYSSGFQVSEGYSHIFDGCKATNNIYGFIFNSIAGAPCVRCVVRNCQADNNFDTVTNVGEGFTDVGTGTPAAPTVSTSIFQSNTAFANGLNTNYFGTNQNYNVLVAPATYVPLLEIKNSSPGTSYTYANPATATQAHNISTIS